MTIQEIQDYMISNYGFESDFTIEIFEMIEHGVNTKSILDYIKMIEENYFGFEF